MSSLKTPIFATGGGGTTGFEVPNGVPITKTLEYDAGVPTDGLSLAPKVDPAYMEFAKPQNTVQFYSKPYNNIAPDPKYKYNEDKLIFELCEYVKKTYSQHYVDEDNFQALDAVIASGHGEGFTIGNVQKYSFRYGKKNGKNRDDLLKVLHYALLALNIHDREAAKS